MVRFRRWDRLRHLTTAILEKESLVTRKTNSETLNILTTRFRDALKKGVEGIIEAGQVLNQAKSEVERGQFTEWVVQELRFGDRRPGEQKADIRKAQMLMYLARDKVISNPCHWHAFPPSPRTLWELTQIRPRQRLLELIANGTINSGMTREEAIALREGGAKRVAKRLRLDPKVAVLVDACIEIGDADCILAHIRSLKRVRKVSPNKAFDNAVNWVKHELTERRQGEK
jgi:hypothetical protein